MRMTRNSKRPAGEKNSVAAAKCGQVSQNENNRKNSDLNRACKQILRKDVLKVINEAGTNKNIAKSSARLIDKLNLQKLTNNESKKVKNVLNSNKNTKQDKENNLTERKISAPIVTKKLIKAKTNSSKQVTNCFPLKTISDNVPIWNVYKNLPQKKNGKQSRVSDIYNIEKDEDLMNESLSVKKKKKNPIKKPKSTKNKVCSEKTFSSHASHNDNLSIKVVKLTETNIAKLTKIPVQKLETSRTIYSNPSERLAAGKNTVATANCGQVSQNENNRKNANSNRACKIDSVPELSDSGLESACSNSVAPTSNSVTNEERPFAMKEITNGNGTETLENSIANVENCINECYSSFINIDVTYSSLRSSVAKCLGSSANGNSTPDKHSTSGQEKSNCLENFINHCYTGCINQNTSLKKSVKNNKSELQRIEKTPEKIPSINVTNSKEVKILKDSHEVPIFLMPKMTSTPENADNPIVHPLKQINNCNLKLSEMSAIPSTASRNIHFELSECEISPIKPASVNQGVSTFGSPCRENVNPKETKFCSRNNFEFRLFESPVKENRNAKKLKISPVKKNIFTNKAALSPVKTDYLEVLKPVNCYQSPHQAKKCRIRTKFVPDACKKAKDNQSKQPISRTKAVGKKQKAKEQDENAIDHLNQHFAELENMELCIE